MRNGIKVGKNVAKSNMQCSSQENKLGLRSKDLKAGQAGQNKHVGFAGSEHSAGADTLKVGTQTSDRGGVEVEPAQYDIGSLNSSDVGLGSKRMPYLKVPSKISIQTFQPAAASIDPLRRNTKEFLLATRPAARPPPKHAQVQTDKDLMVLLACQLFCNEITEALVKEKEKKEPRPLIRNEIFADVPVEEIPAILK